MLVPAQLVHSRLLASVEKGPHPHPRPFLILRGHIVLDSTINSSQAISESLIRPV